MYPIVPISLGPYLSTAIPVNGPKMREVRTMGVNSSPVCKAVNPKTDCDCVGIVASKTARMVACMKATSCAVRRRGEESR